jgi:hypothetical protein
MRESPFRIRPSIVQTRREERSNRDGRHMTSLGMTSPDAAALPTPPAVADATPPFMFDCATETMPRADLAALQLQRLKKSLAHAYKVPHIRRKFQAAGVTPDTLTSLAEIAHFPFTEKSDLRDTYPFGMFAVPREQVLRIHASSGTTGKPTVVGYTRTDLDLWPARGRATSFTTPRATACLPAASAPITAPNAWAAPWSRCRAAPPNDR